MQCFLIAGFLKDAISNYRMIIYYEQPDHDFLELIDKYKNLPGKFAIKIIH